MRAIFVSYRRGDSEGEAGRLFDDLVQEFGENSVFMDVAAIEAGRDFRKVIDESVATCGVLLAVIGKEWVDAKNEAGQRRLDDPSDFVRLETASALKRDIPVIPVLVHDARMPRTEQLPDDLKELAYRNGVELTHARWKSDVQLLIKALRPHVQDRTNVAPSPSQAAAEIKPLVRMETNVPEVPVKTSSIQRKKPLGIALALVAVLVVGMVVAYTISMHRRAAEEQRVAAEQEAIADKAAADRAAAERALAQEKAFADAASAGRSSNSGTGAGRAQGGPASQLCQILPSFSEWTLPGTAEVFIDDIGVGGFRFGHKGSTALAFHCTPGQHRFRFNIAVDGRSMACSGSVHLSNGAQLNPGIQVQNGQPTCGLTEQ